MQISKKWLNYLLNSFINIKKIIYLLNIIGFEIEKIKINKPYFSKIIIGKIIYSFKIFNLNIYKIKIKKKKYIYILYNKINLKNNIKIICLISKKKIKINNFNYIKIYGILCTEKILNISYKNNLINISNNFIIGKNIFNYFSFLNEIIYSVKLNPNRFDCSSFLGFSKEILIFNKILKKKKKKKLFINYFYKIPIKIYKNNIYGRFVTRIIKNINTNINTPIWILKKLKENNIKHSKFILKNILYYSNLELGQLFNIYNLNKIYKNLNFRLGKKKEKIKISKNIKLNINNNIIICDNKKIFSLIGIINKFNKYKYNFKNIYIVCYFLNIKNNNFFFKKYNFHNENIFKIKRIITFSNLIKNIERISELIIKICGNLKTKIGLINDKIFNLPKKKFILFNIKNIKKYLGIKLNLFKIIKIFNKINLNFIKKNNFFIIKIPSYRYDLIIKEDLIEEIIRIYGIFNIPSSLFNVKNNFLKIKKESKKSLLEIYNLISNYGYNEVINYSFINYKWEYLLNKKNIIKIINPISNKLNVLRSSLIPGLISNIIYNIKYKKNIIKLFEIGNIFIKHKNKIKQIKKLACINYSSYNKNIFNTNYYKIKSDLENFFYPLILKFKKKYHPFLNKKISTSIILNNKKIGILGELNLKFIKKYKFIYNPVLFEIKIHSLINKNIPKYISFSKKPIIIKDISLILNKSVKIQKIFNIFENNKNNKFFSLIKKIIFINEYINNKHKNYKKNLTFRLFFQNDKNYLNNNNIKYIIFNIIKNIYKKIY